MIKNLFKLSFLLLILTATSQVFAYTQISAGGNHTCALKNDGSAVCWGLNNYLQTVVPSGKFTKIGAGNYHSCALRSDGSVICWGDPSFIPEDIKLGVFTDISVGFKHTCALKNDSSVVCWGYSSDGQTLAPLGKFTQVSAGGGHTCALKADGSVTCWGLNNYGQATPPKGVFTQVSSGNLHTCALKADGSAICWGDNSAAQNVVPVGSFTQIVAGATSTCALKVGGNITCWGFDDNGQIKNTPTGVFTQIDVGNTHTCALKADGMAICWGFNGYEAAIVPPETYNVKVNITGNGKVAGFGNYAIGVPVTLTPTADSGWTFTGWIPSSCGNGFKMLSSDVVCAANFIKNVSIIVKTNGNGKASIGNGNTMEVHTTGDVITLLATPDAGYTFTGWTPTICQDKFNMPSSDVVCTANFSIKSFTVTVNTTGNGKAEGGKSYAVGSQVTLTATADKGWTFTKWTPSTCSNSFKMPTNDLTCTANFSMETHTVTVNVNGHGKAIVGNGKSTEIHIVGDAITLSATPDDGYIFTGWNPASCQNSFYMPSSDVVCTANFSKPIDIAFKGIEPHYKAGDRVKIDFDMHIKTGSRFDKVDLWVAMQLPSKQFVFMNPLKQFLVEAQLFKADIEQLELTQTLMDIEVPHNLGGTYTFYAVCVQKGKNPLPEPAGDGESVRCSDVIIGTTTLDN